MASNLAIDCELLREAQMIGGHKTKKETVNIALKEYVQHHKQEKIIELFDTIEHNESYHYKEGRGR